MGLLQFLFQAGLYFKNSLKYKITQRIIEICKGENVIPEQIKQVTVIASERTFDRVGRTFKLEKGPLQVKAQFSIPYTVAVAICKGDVFLEDFEEENICNDKVFNLSKNLAIFWLRCSSLMVLYSASCFNNPESCKK